MKIRVLKKHNNQYFINGRYNKDAAPDYAKGIKVYELGLYPSDPDKLQLSMWFMCYSSNPIKSHDSQFYKLIKKRRSAHSYTELVRGDIVLYYTNLR